MRKVQGRHGGTLHALEKGETANPNGRPRKGISFVNKQLSERGYIPAKKQDIEANYMQMIQLEKSEIEFLSKDPNQPMVVQIIAQNLLSDRGFDILEKMLDRGIGKAKETIHAEIENEISSESMDAINKLIALKNGRKTSSESPQG